MSRNDTDDRISALFAAWARGEIKYGKRDVYPEAWRALDAGRITLKRIVEIAGTVGISEGVIRMRRRDLFKMAVAS